MQTMMRNAEDDFMTLIICDAMLKAGGDVFAITPNGMGKYETAIDPHQRFIVWCKVMDVGHMHDIDIAIGNALESEYGG